MQNGKIEMAQGCGGGPGDTLIDIADASELTGFAISYLRRLLKEAGVCVIRRQEHEFIPWKAVVRLLDGQRPFWQFTTNSIDVERVVLRPCAVLRSGPKSRDTLEIRDSPVLCSPREGIQVNDCISWCKEIESGSIQSVVTSPPYWGQRRYADETPIVWMDGETTAFGREPAVESYVRHTLEILRHLKRILREDGTIWWVLGDTYHTRTIVRTSTTQRWNNYQGKEKTVWAENPDRRVSAGHPYLKDKDLALVPFLVAHAAQHIGLYVRSMIVWSKQQRVSRKQQNEPSRTHMPEPVKDRPTLGHEYILLMAKSSTYEYSEPRLIEELEGETHRKLRSVWSFPVSTSHGAHTAAFPIELPLRCISLATEPGDWVADPFVGSGNTLLAAARLGRKAIGCDISPKYAAEANERLAREQAKFRAQPTG
jgi:DNA modification methylase